MVLKSWLGVVIAAGILISSGFDRPGAHAVQVYLDNELVVEKYVTSKMDIQRVHLDPSKNKQLNIRYNECGRTVSGRKLTIRDSADKELKTWRFEGATAGFKDPMKCEITDILALVKGSKAELELWYSSNDFPEGVHVVSLVGGTDVKASR